MKTLILLIACTMFCLYGCQSNEGTAASSAKQSSEKSSSAPSDELSFTAASGDGITKGMALTFKGLNVGTVESVGLADKGVKVLAKLDPTAVGKVPAASYGVLETGGKGAQLKVVEAKAGGDKLKGGETLALARTEAEAVIADEKFNPPVMIALCPASMPVPPVANGTQITVTVEGVETKVVGKVTGTLEAACKGNPEIGRTINVKLWRKHTTNLSTHRYAVLDDGKISLETVERKAAARPLKTGDSLDLALGTMDTMKLQGRYKAEILKADAQKTLKDAKGKVGEALVKTGTTLVEEGKKLTGDSP